MKRLYIILVALILTLPCCLCAQEITYSEFRNEDNRDMAFEILGKMNGSYIIYKNIRWKHMLAFYDQDMRLKKSLRMAFVPDKTFNIDFITYPDHFFMIYQYQKNNIVYCKGVKMGIDGKKLGEPIDLDTTRINILSDNKIYNTVYSQDKQRILLYKMHRKNQQLHLVTKLFDANLKMIDSTREVSPFDDRRDVYSELFLDNDGQYLYTKGLKRPTRDNIEELSIVYRKPGDAIPIIAKLDISGKFLHEIQVKVDNLNKKYIINSLYSDQEGGSIKGLFTAVVNVAGVGPVKTAFNDFPDSLRLMVNKDGQYRFAFDNLFLRQAIVKKDGGFILTAEDYATQSRSGIGNSNWNRYNYLYNSPYTTYSDFYLLNPTFDGYYRPMNSFNNRQNIRYFYDNILVLSFDNNLKMLWENVIPKKQSDDDNDNFLSFTTMNAGGEIHFIYIEEDRNKQVISNHSILPGGQVKRYPTLKSREIGYEFMPRFAKQVAVRELIIPCIYHSNIAFAKVVFYE